MDKLNPNQNTAHAENQLFAATQWSVVLRARDNSEAALNRLCTAYRQPLIVWLRPRGYSQPDAEDLVHGLLAQLLDRDFLKKVAEEKGRFRTFLIKCLKNYLRDQAAKGRSAKRGGGQPTESLDETYDEGERIHDPADGTPTPDAAFDRAWVANLLANGLKRLHEECARKGHAALWSELEPVFHDESAVGYREIAIRLGMTEAAVKMAASRIRARLRGILREEIRETVSNESDWQDEVKYLMQLFAK